MKSLYTCLVAIALVNATSAAPQTESFAHSGKITILTTPEGANLPAGAAIDDFPLLIRLQRDWFDFSQAKANGDDIRFISSTGASLAYQVEEWSPSEGEASIWVRIPHIDGNARQTIQMQWGNPAAISQSDGKAVFNASNGYLGVWHMNDVVKDDVGSLESTDTGTTSTRGMIGTGRNFTIGKGIFCGDKITQLPTDDSPHSTEAWFRAEQSNGNIVGWGNEKAQGKIVMGVASPPHIRIDGYFSAANVESKGALAMKEWNHVVHTYENGESRLYINGELDGLAQTKNSQLKMNNPARMWIGGWYNNYQFLGDMDEVRISQVKRSADWIRLQYENQKPQQTVTGPIVQKDAAFAVSPTQATVNEGKSITFTMTPGAAEKIYWILKMNGTEKIVATDRFSFTFATDRITGDQSAVIQCKAIYPNEIKTKEIAVTIKEDIPDPLFTLKAPTTWDGRSAIDVIPQISNLSAMQSKQTDKITTRWDIAPIAVIKQQTAEKLQLLRAQNSGAMTVTATISNGGSEIKQSVTINVTEPKQDPWVARTAEQNEQPEDSQFYARDDKNEGTLFYNGSLTENASAAFIKVYANDKPFKNDEQKPKADNSYAFTIKLKPGLIKYKVEFGTKDNGKETIVRTVSDIVCGDAYIINGQSNAVSMDWGKGEFPETNEWIRSYGSMGNDPKSAKWGPAIRKCPGDKLAIGYWAFDLGKDLLEKHKMPICILNGAVGGTRIDQHQRNPENAEDLTTIYGRLLWRVHQAKLTHGIRGILWHQGENDQGSDGPSGGYGWENYHQYFVDLAATWKQDYPNIQHYYIFQIWPLSCSMGRNGSDNRLREVQRRLPESFSNMSIMSTLGIEPEGGCHYPAEGYAIFAKLIAPLVHQYNYGIVPKTSITPPNLKKSAFTSAVKNEILLEFDQPIIWTEELASQFYLDGEIGKVASGKVNGNTLTLTLTAPSNAKDITYLNSQKWSQKNILRGANGIAALTFCEVPIAVVTP